MRSMEAHQVLLVCKHQDCAVTHQWVLHNDLRRHACMNQCRWRMHHIKAWGCTFGTALPDLELVGGSADSLSVLTVHHIDEPVRVVEVVPPEGPELFLASHVPDCE